MVHFLDPGQFSGFPGSFFFKVNGQGLVALLYLGRFLGSIFCDCGFLVDSIKLGEDCHLKLVDP